jgi:uncharacterized repeat protein (TIGR03803 family)
MSFWRGVSILLLTVGGLSASAWAQNFAILYNFAGGANDGANPYGSLIAIGPDLYGMTAAGGGTGVGAEGGGALGDGTIFSFNTVTNTESALHSFTGYPTDGAAPLGSLIQSSTSASTLYGMTVDGGTQGFGTIFSFNTTNNNESPLYSFGNLGLTGSQGSLL